MSEPLNIMWQDPSPLKAPGNKPKWRPVLEAVMAQPQRWAVVQRTATPQQAANNAASLRRRRVSVPPGAWEFTSRAVRGHGLVYARYLGPVDET